jgi:hypothetical protein
MRGTYVIKQGDVEIARSENLITTAGKRAIVSFLAGAGAGWSDAIAIGAGTAAAVVGDSALQLEYDRQGTLAKAVVFNGGGAGIHRVICKATIPSNVSGWINELGIFSQYEGSSQTSSNTMLAGLFDDEDWEVYSGGTWIDIATAPDTSNSRVGANATTLTSGTTLTKYRVNLADTDYTLFGASDRLKFGAYLISGTLSAVTIKFYTDDSNYFAYTPTTATFCSASTGVYTASSFLKSNWTATGSPTWSNISSMGVDITATSGTVNVAFDAARFEDADSYDESYCLVSRSVLSPAIQKVAGTELDIEYYLDI